MGLLLFFTAPPGCASAQHPQVPLLPSENSPDYSTCVTCHANRTEGATVHPAVLLGCDGCHTAERYKEETDVFLNTEGNDLCFACHEDKRPTNTQVSTHWPIRKNRCIECHDPHATAAPYLLRRATEGTSRSENLCLTCHEEIADQIERPVKHAVIEFGCGTCHTTHRSEPDGAQEGMYHLTKSSPGLCLDCHDGSDASLQAAHHGQPFATANCAECHNPHGSDNPKLLNNVLHPPFQADCETCHLEPKDGKVVLQEGGRRTLCLVCHTGVEEAIAQATTEHPPATMDDGCVICHSPHAGTAAKQLRLGPVSTCTACHSETGDARANKQYLHRPAFELGCAVCHRPHGGSRGSLLRAEVNDLCLECHDSAVTRKVGIAKRDGKPVVLFQGALELPAAAFEGINTITLSADRDRGHPFLARHPVQGKYQLGDNMSCVTCHNPHATNGNPKLFVTEDANQWVLCRTCHSKDIS